MRKEVIIGASLLILCVIAIGIGMYIIFSQKIRKDIPDDKMIPAAFVPKKKVAIVRIYGEISFQNRGKEFIGRYFRGADRIIRRLYAIQQNPAVKAVVVRINSPGGTVAATQEIYNQLQELRKHNKKVVVSICDIGASGAYYIACAGDKIIADEGSLIGSIGVIIHVPDLSMLMEKLGVNIQVLKSGKHKDIGAYTRKMTEEEREILQGVVDDAYQQFYQAVKQSRKNIPESMLKELADGRIFTGRQAKKFGLIDELGDYYTAIEIAAQLAGIKGEPIILDEEDPLQWLLELIECICVPDMLVQKGYEILTQPCLAYLWRPKL
jgi:protease-4